MDRFLQVSGLSIRPELNFPTKSETGFISHEMSNYVHIVSDSTILCCSVRLTALPTQVKLVQVMP